ncbi:MAG TPA: cobyric acid synthase [Mycobacteriales bacterium]|nr:cobyric acid synthase [Mycobacteriales bacterium]
MNGALLVAGTHSDAGKSVIVAGLCRWLARQGVSVAPFKAQNMALNSAVTADGAEIGRAQAMQAAAAMVEPTAQMNPVLIKPGSDTHSHITVLGRPWRDVDAAGYQPLKQELREVALDALRSLRDQYDVVICEGAGSPAEINLRVDDLANMGLARAANLPVVIVGDIDRGGVFASLFGNLALLDAEDQRLVAGFVINKFRGDHGILAPGLAQLQALTGRPTYGVLPWRSGIWLEGEDSLSLESREHEADAAGSGGVLRVAVVRLPRLSNYTDLDALACESNVVLRFVNGPEQLVDADLVVIPGTRSTVADLQWLRERGLADAITRHAASHKPVMGICGGYQMLGGRIVDGIESDVAEIQGLGLLPVETTFSASKTLQRRSGHHAGLPVDGYQIHHGRVDARDATALLLDNDGEPEGCVAGVVSGTTWHGVFDRDEFRRDYLRGVAQKAGRAWKPGSHRFAELREARLETLADLVADGLDEAAIRSLIDDGVPHGLPTVTSTLSPAQLEPTR